MYKRQHVGSAIEVLGKVVESPKEGQAFEIQAEKVSVHPHSYFHG